MQIWQKAGQEDLKEAAMTVQAGRQFLAIPGPTATRCLAFRRTTEKCDRQEKGCDYKPL